MGGGQGTGGALSGEVGDCPDAFLRVGSWTLGLGVWVGEALRPDLGDLGFGGDEALAPIVFFGGAGLVAWVPALPLALPSGARGLAAGWQVPRLSLAPLPAVSHPDRPRDPSKTGGVGKTIRASLEWQQQETRVLFVVRRPTNWKGGTKGLYIIYRSPGHKIRYI